MENGKRIFIRKSPSADSRTAQGPVSVEELRESTYMHKCDVQNALRVIADVLMDKGNDHDHTKFEHMDEFHAALSAGKVKESQWYQMHVTEERHHLKSRVPDNVNLMDVIEHVTDCTMAGLARSGEVYDINLPPELLALAVKNTVNWLIGITEISDGDDKDDIMDQEI